MDGIKRRINKEKKKTSTSRFRLTWVYKIVKARSHAYTSHTTTCACFSFKVYSSFTCYYSRNNKLKGMIAMEGGGGRRKQRGYERHHVFLPLFNVY